MLAKLVERAGRFANGSITAFYTVFMEGDDQQDPIVDTVRSLLDGHIVLDRKLSLANHYPPISVLDSLSRLMPSVCSQEHLQKVGASARCWRLTPARKTSSRSGRIRKGSDPTLDRAISRVAANQRISAPGSERIGRTGFHRDSSFWRCPAKYALPIFTCRRSEVSRSSGVA